MKNGIILGIAIGALATACMMDRKKEEHDFFKKCKKGIAKKFEDFLKV